jgi:hypothetical protein
LATQALANEIGSKAAHGRLFVDRRFAENNDAAIAGNRYSIVHTAPAFNPTAREAALQDRLSLGQNVREDDDAQPYLELC